MINMYMENLRAVTFKQLAKLQNASFSSMHSANALRNICMNVPVSRATASVDATMATWGGSTVDNLESITEDEDTQAINEMEEDDGKANQGNVCQIKLKCLFGLFVVNNISALQYFPNSMVSLQIN